MGGRFYLTEKLCATPPLQKWCFSPRMLLEPLEVQASFSYAIHIVLYSLFWLWESKSLGTKGKPVSRKMTKPMLLLSPICTTLRAFGITLLTTPPIQQQSSSQEPTLAPFFSFCADHSTRLGPLPFLGCHNQSFSSSLSAIRHYYSSVAHWLVKCVVTTFQLECRLPEGKRHAFFISVPRYGLC